MQRVENCSRVARSEFASSFGSRFESSVDFELNLSSFGRKSCDSPCFVGVEVVVGLAGWLVGGWLVGRSFVANLHVAAKDLIVLVRPSVVVAGVVGGLKKEKKIGKQSPKKK